ncbi:TRAP transporter substrate-binding protein [Vibrio sp. SCSIO 43135]|uniref:TRAP transporter substrate-binding protein n=1 Tax=Vibrio paucivorans TaxID=2829489 RepID=A0A9X3CDV3_9VIBR|nr:MULTISPECIES: TRAP transporter substrate-binding protein [Vibrio]MCW8333839.1 TRAP transporter substrate-binding protein [Vibrio paucivorans]USD40957.1 TRAP transporter substrate-binding protein [Vibrio sp. SCSIO 43135]
MKNTKLTLTAVAITTLLSTSAFAKDLKVATSAQVGSLQYNTTQYFTEVANEEFKKQGIDYNLKFFGAAQLGKDKDVQQKLKLGTVDLALLTSTLPTHVSEMALFELPFLVSDREHVAKIEQDVFWPYIAPAAEKKGYKVIGFWENGFRNITNAKRPINTPEDLQGLKVRTPNSSWRVKMFKNWGANPTPMSFSEVFIGLQTGVIDGQENPYTNIYAAKLHEVQGYLSVTNHVYTPAYLTAGARHYGKFPDDVRAVLESSAKQAQQWGYQEATKLETELKDKLVAGGMKLNVANRDAFVSASQPIYDDFVKNVNNGEVMLDKVMAASN